jgi:type II secretory pathway component PulM
MHRSGAKTPQNADNGTVSPLARRRLGSLASQPSQTVWRTNKMKERRQLMKTIPVITLVACATGLWAGPAIANNSSKLTYERGVISSVNTTAHEFVIKEHKQAPQTFQWTDATTFARGKQGATAAALKPGETVRVGYMAGTTPLTAQTLEIKPAWGLHHQEKKAS